MPKHERVFVVGELSVNIDFRRAAIASALCLGLWAPSLAQIDSTSLSRSDTAGISPQNAPREVPVAVTLPTKERLPVVAITSLDAKEGVTSGEAAVIADNLAVQLQQSGVFRVMERSQMEQILKEQSFQQSGACDGSQCAVEMGKLLGIDRMVIGSIGKVGTVYSLSLRLVDVGSGEALRTTAHNRKGGIEDVLTDLLPLAVADLTGKPAPVVAKAPEAPVVPVVAAAPALAPAPKPTAPEPVAAVESKGSIWPWLVGGAVVAGGGAAAVVLLSGNSSTSATASTGSTPTTSSDNHFQVSW